MDLDNDRMADAWELAHGLSNANAADALLDSDNDGQTNLEEYASNTDPSNGASTFLPQNPSYDASTGVVSMSFELAPNRTYTLHRSDDLTTWQTKAT